MDDFEDTLYGCVGEIFTQETYDDMSRIYETKMNETRDEMRVALVQSCNTFAQKVLSEFNNKMIAIDERNKIDRIMRLALLDYFNKIAISTYSNELRDVPIGELVKKIKNINRTTDANIGFFNDEHIGAKLAYSLKLNMVANRTNIPISAIDKYIVLNKNTHFMIKPFKTNGYVQIRESIEKIKSIGCAIDDEDEISEIRKFIE